MVTKLSDLEIEEVSLVDVPANNKRIIYKALNKGDEMARITKFDLPPEIPGPEKKKPEDEEEELEEEGMPNKSASASAAQEAAQEVVQAAEDAKRAAEQAEVAAEAAGKVAEAAMAAVEPTPEPAMPEPEPEIPHEEMKAEGEEKPMADGTPVPEIQPGEGEDPMVEEEEEEDKEQVADEAPKYCAQCGGELVDGKCSGCAEKSHECVGKSKKKPAKKSKVSVDKAVVELQKAQMKIAELEKAAMDARQALIQKEFVEKASKEFSHIPGVSSEQLGAVLKNASETMSPEHYTTLNTVLKAAEAVLSQNILTQTIGVKAESRMMDGSAASRLHAKATEIMGNVSKSGERITYEKAYMKAMNDNPALYQEYLSGK